MLSRHLRDATVAVGERLRPTFPARLPMLRLDHVFVNGAVEPVRTQTVAHRLTRIASDHLPVVAEIRIAAG
jgi:endonuclease/exonuclease/phosphatase family metal-dependent hydrolase